MGAGAWTTWSGDVLRATEPKWASLPYRLTGAGGVLAGGRWNVKSLMPAVYFSADLKTLNAEADAKAVRYGWPAGMLHPQTRITLTLKLPAVLDLTNRSMLRAVNLTHAELMSCDWEADQSAGRESISQAIARVAFELRAEGLVVRSARSRNGVNIVYFPSHRRDGTTVMTHDETKIPIMHGLP